MTSTTTVQRAAVAETLLKGSVTLWFALALIGQWAFLYYIAVFYGPTTLTGDFAAWGRNGMLFRGYVPGDTVGNVTFGAHALLAGIIAFGGALQLAPQVRARAPVFHRWNGRVFIVTAVGLSLAGFYLVWVRGTGQSLAHNLAISGNGVLILAFAGLAWRTALARDFVAHRRWALRLYLVSNAQWFMRVGMFAWFMASQGGASKAVNAAVFLGWAWGCYLAPLAILELYLRSRQSSAAAPRFAMAGLLLMVSLLMAGGMIGFTLFSQQVLAGKMA